MIVAKTCYFWSVFPQISCGGYPQNSSKFPKPHFLLTCTYFGGRRHGRNLPMAKATDGLAFGVTRHCRIEGLPPMPPTPKRRGCVSVLRPIDSGRVYFLSSDIPHKSDSSALSWCHASTQLATWLSVGRWRIETGKSFGELHWGWTWSQETSKPQQDSSPTSQNHPSKKRLTLLSDAPKKDEERPTQLPDITWQAAVKMLKKPRKTRQWPAMD